LPEIGSSIHPIESVVSTTIVGMRKPEHVKQNIAASDAGPLDQSFAEKT
jgi:aryl-alcohol dehydrogenase-like predicted oxidoreductase